MAISKVVYGGNTLIDLTGDTVDASALLKGYTAHGADGEPVTGVCEYDSDTSDATATVAEILAGKTAYVRGAKVAGTMPNNGSVTQEISTVGGTAGIAQGYHDGSGYTQIAAAERAKIIASNIKAGVKILGVTGSYSGASISAQAKSVTPGVSAQTVLPDSSYDYLSQVTVGAIPYVESENAAGGITVTIAG